MPSAFMTVDPGAKGAVAWGSDPRRPKLIRMPGDLMDPDSIRGFHEAMLAAKREEPGMAAVIEKVGGYVGEAQPGSSMFTFGWNACVPFSLIAVSGIMIHRFIAPVSWQRHLALPKRRGPGAKTQHKRDLKDLAAKLFPEIRVTLDNADALLLYHLAHIGKI